MKLSDCAKGRDNNLNLIRMVAAISVLISHSFAISTGNPLNEPFGASTGGPSLGAMAVWIFFATSGFLVTGSLLNRKDLVDFMGARALRIYPALFVMLFLTALFMGGVITSDSVTGFFINGETHSYFVRCSTLVTGVLDRLPGVFVHNPFEGSVNGSLWTLPWEIRMYLSLAFIWGLVILTRNKKELFFKLAVTSIVLIVWLRFFDHLISGHRPHAILYLVLMFFTGSMFYCFKERIVLNKAVFFLVAFLTTLSLISHDLYRLMLLAGLPYMLFYLAYVPCGIVRQYNKLGDYSYGVYIYAFPVQQTIVHYFHGINSYELIFSAALVVLPLAALSWHFIEKKSLAYKSRLRTCLGKFWFGEVKGTA